MSKIKVNLFDIESINNAINQIKLYQISLDKKIEEVLSRLSTLGVEVIEYQYGLSHEDYYEVDCIVNGNSSMIIAEGENVMFLEFGTGIYTDDYTEEGEVESQGLPVIFPGSWSNTEGMGQFRPDHQYWYHKHVMYQGTLPTRGFYFASKEIKAQAVDIAKKVFKK